MTYPFVRMGAVGMERCGGILPPATYANIDAAKNRKSMVFDPAIKPYLEFDQVQGDPTTFTYFATIKIANASDGRMRFIMGAVAESEVSANHYLYLRSDGQLSCEEGPGEIMGPFLKDTSAWYSIMITLKNSVMSMWVNGKSYPIVTAPNDDVAESRLFNPKYKFVVGKLKGLTGSTYDEGPFSGQMTMVGCIDGVALPDMFALGDFDKDTGEWVPKDPDTTGWKNNSFYLSGLEVDTTDFVQQADWNGSATQKMILNPSDNERVDWAFVNNPTNGYMVMMARDWGNIGIPLQKAGAVDTINAPLLQWGDRTVSLDPAGSGWTDTMLKAWYGPAGARYGITFLKYTGNGLAQSLQHGLGKKPGAVWIRRHDGGSMMPWWDGFKDNEILNFHYYEQKVWTANARVWVNAKIDDKVFTLAETNGGADQTLVNAPGVTYYAVFFASQEGFMDVGTVIAGQVRHYRNVSNDFEMDGNKYIFGAYTQVGTPDGGASTMSLYAVGDGSLAWKYELPNQSVPKNALTVMRCDNGKNYIIAAGPDAAGNNALEVWDFTATGATRVFGSTGVAHNYNDVTSFRQGNNYYVYTAAVSGADIGSLGGCVIYKLNPDTGALTRAAVAPTTFSNGVATYEINGKTYLINIPSYINSNGSIYEWNGSNLVAVSGYGKDIGLYIDVHNVDGELYITNSYGYGVATPAKSYLYRVVPATGLLMEVASVPHPSMHGVVMRRNGQLLWLIATGTGEYFRTFRVYDNPANPTADAKMAEEISRTGFSYAEFIKKVDVGGKAVIIAGGMGNGSWGDGWITVRTFNDKTFSWAPGKEIPFKPSLSFIHGTNNTALKTHPDLGWLSACYDHSYGTSMRAFPGAYNTPSVVANVTGVWQGASKYSYLDNLHSPHVYITFADRTYTTTFERTPTPLGRLYSRTQDDTLEMSYDHPLNNTWLARRNTLPDTMEWGGFGASGVIQTTSGASIGQPRKWQPGTYAEYTLGDAVTIVSGGYGQPAFHIWSGVSPSTAGIVFREMSNAATGNTIVAVKATDQTPAGIIGTRLATPTVAKAGDVYSILYDTDGTFSFYQNGVRLYTFPVDDAASNFQVLLWLDGGPGHVNGIHQVNYGSHPWIYPPAGKEFQGAGKASASINSVNIIDPKKFFCCKKHVGTGDDKPLTVATTGFRPSFCLYKSHQNGGNWLMVDELLPGKIFSLNNIIAAWDKADTKIVDTGLQVGGGTCNITGQDYCLIAWKASKCSGVYHGLQTATGGPTTFNHGLGKMPKMVWTRVISQEDHFWIMHNRGDGRFGLDFSGMPDALYLGDRSTGKPWFSVTEETLTFPSLTAGQQMLVYIFTDIPGFSAFASHKGTNASTGWITGFRPALYNLRWSTSVYRLMPGYLSTNPMSKYLMLNLTNPVETTVDTYNFTANGVMAPGPTGGQRDQNTPLWIDEFAFADQPWETANGTV